MKRITPLMQLQILILTLLLTFSVQAQVGIGTNNPSDGSILDITSADKGILVPRVNIANLGNIAPVTGGATVGLLVWNTSATTGVGYHYWSGSAWVPLSGGSVNDDWKLAGNAAAAADFLGTTNGQDLRVRTNNALRMRVLSDGRVIINEVGGPYFAGDQFTVEGLFSINGYTTNGIGVYGEGTTGVGVWGETVDNYAVLGQSTNFAGVRGLSVNDVGVWGVSNTIGAVGDALIAGTLGVGADGSIGYGGAADGIGVIGSGNSLLAGYSVLTIGGTPVGSGVAGTGTEAGVAGFGTSGTSIGTIGIAGGVGAQGQGFFGLLGFGDSTNGVGMDAQGADGARGFAESTTGIGLVGSGNNIGASYSILVDAMANPIGSGLAATGTQVGAYGNGSNSTGLGVIGIGGTALGGVGSQGQGYDGVVGLASGANGIGVFGDAPDTGVQGQGQNGVVGIAGATANNVGTFGQGRIGVLGQVDASGPGPNNNKWGVFSNGNSGATGTKSFVIDHPLDPANKILKHFSIESNEILNVYRGKETFDSNGKAIITLPNYYEAVNKNASYQLTPIGAAMPNLYIEQEVENGQFVIAGGVPGKKVSWQLTAERNDPYLQQNPSERITEIGKGEASGKYYMPNLYGRSSDLSLTGLRKNKAVTPLDTKVQTSKKADHTKYESNTVNNETLNELTSKIVTKSKNSEQKTKANKKDLDKKKQ